MNGTIDIIYDLTKSCTCTRSTPNQSIRQNCFQPTFVHTPRWSMLPLGKAASEVPCKVRGKRETRYGCKNLVLPSSTFTHGRLSLGSIGLTKESGHSVRSMSTTLFWAKQGTSTLVPVGNVYVDDIKGNRSCGSIFVGQVSDNISFGRNPDTKGSCEDKHARAASASLILFSSPPCASHSKNRKGVLSPDGPDGKGVPQRASAPSAKDMQWRRRTIKQNDMDQSAWVYWPIWSITASICVSKSFFWSGSCSISATQSSQMAFLFSHSLRLQKVTTEKKRQEVIFVRRSKKTSRQYSTEMYLHEP